MPKIIHMMSGPRNLSTAMMYALGNRMDCKVIDEPFYAYYLDQTGLNHPGREEVIASQPTDHRQVINKIQSHTDADMTFVKNMAHHMIMEDWSFIQDWTNILLIRDPKQVIASYAQQMTDITIDDIGIEQLWQVYQYLKARELHPVVIDSVDILDNPYDTLRALCKVIDIPWSDRMLDWDAGPRPEDGIWAKYWYAGVHQSTGFAKRSTSDRALPDEYLTLYKEALKYYQLLRENALRTV